MTNMKFKVENSEQFKKLQKVLFKLGYSFHGDTETVNFSHSTRFVYAEDNNKLYLGLSSSIFKSDPAVEKDTQKFIAEHTKRLKRKSQC